MYCEDCVPVHYTICTVKIVYLCTTLVLLRLCTCVLHNMYCEDCVPLYYTICTVKIVYLCTTVMSITSTLAKWDFLAFSMYKYVGMIFSLFSGFLLSKLGYYSALLYSTLALAIFLFRTLHLRIEPEVWKLNSKY